MWNCCRVHSTGLVQVIAIAHFQIPKCFACVNSLGLADSYCLFRGSIHSQRFCSSVGIESVWDCLGLLLWVHSVVAGVWGLRISLRVCWHSLSLPSARKHYLFMYISPYFMLHGSLSSDSKSNHFACIKSLAGEQKCRFLKSFCAGFFQHYRNQAQYYCVLLNLFFKCRPFGSLIL